MTVLDVSGIDLGRTKEISEVRGTSLKFNLDVRWQSQGVIYAVRPLNGSPATHTHTHGSDEVLWFHIGRPCVCAFVSRTSIHPSISFSFPGDNLSKHQKFSWNLVCAVILWTSGLGLLMGKFRQILLSARMAGYCS